MYTFLEIAKTLKKGGFGAFLSVFIILYALNSVNIFFTKKYTLMEKREFLEKQYHVI